MSVKVAIDLSDNNIWDDSLLIKAYDESKKLASADVAKRIAHSTNKKCGGSFVDISVANNSTDLASESESATSTDETVQTTNNQQSISNNYKIGDHVRCTFSEDGKDYEAKIISFPTEQSVLIRYLGYNNEEIVDITALVQTWGKQYRKQQIYDAKVDMTLQKPTKQITVDPQQLQDGKKRRINKKNQHQNQNGISSCESFQSLNKNLIQPPPQPPMPPMLADISEESEHLSAMLMSWYMSGYYTGLYQGIKQNKSNKMVPPTSQSAGAAAASSSSSSKKRGNGKR